MVLKPASATPLTALRIARLFEEAGLPPGWLNVVTCGGAVANHLVEHPDVALITFTGSPEVGWGIRARAARKRVGLELGNNAPVIVEPSADVDLATSKIAVGGYAFAGQSCISVQRAYVHRSLHGQFVEALAEKVASLTVGEPHGSRHERQCADQPEGDRTCRRVARRGRGPGRRHPRRRRPRRPRRPAADAGRLGDTRDEDQQHRGVRAGGRGHGVRHLRRGRRLANDTRYGLQAAVFTSDISTALAAASRLDFGGVLVNEVPTWRADQQPYGGVRDSGNTREGPAYAVEELTERRMVVIQG